MNVIWKGAWTGRERKRGRVSIIIEKCFCSHFQFITFTVLTIQFVFVVFFFCWTQLYTSGHPPFRVFSTWCKFDVCSSEHSRLTASRRYDICPEIIWLRLFQHKIDKQLLRKSYKCFYSAAHVPLRFVEKVLFFVACNQSLAWFQKIKNWTVYKWDCQHVKFLKNMGWFIFFSPSPFPTIVNHSFLSKWFIIGSVFWS